MNDKIVRYTLRVNKELFEKFKYIAGYNGRSANKEIEQYIKRFVARFESEHGEIPLDEK